jgi:hypothetical protein
MADRTTGHAPEMSAEEWAATKDALYTHLQTFGAARPLELMDEFELSLEQVQQAMTEISTEHPEVREGRWQPSMW